MVMKRLIGLLFTIVLSVNTALAGGGDKITTENYIDLWKETAIRNMQSFGIPASIILAQGILESASGNSKLAKEGKNHFGIKCHGWEGDKIYHDDDKKGECFRVYKTAEESFQDHALFLKNRSRYAFLFEYASNDYKSWAKGLKKAGYATNPKYPQLLISIIDRWELHKYDDANALERIAKESKPVKEKPSKPELSSEELVITLNRKVELSSNAIKSIQAKQGDTPKAVAEDFDMAPWQIKKYNEVGLDHIFEQGEIIYLQPKRRKNCKLKRYRVEEGQNLYDVSQATGVKTKHLQKLNQISGVDVSTGAVIKLCKKQ